MEAVQVILEAVPQVELTKEGAQVVQAEADQVVQEETRAQAVVHQIQEALLQAVVRQEEAHQIDQARGVIQAQQVDHKQEQVAHNHQMEHMCQTTVI